MAEMEDVEAAVGDHEAFALGVDAVAPRGKIGPGDKFLVKIHLIDIGGTLAGLAIFQWRLSLCARGTILV